MRWIVAPLALLLLAVPAFPSAAAQTADSSPYVAVFSDTFDSERGWDSPVSDASAGWFRIADGKVNDQPRMVWYAARLDADGGPGGYGNNVNAELTSPAVLVPQGMSMHGIVLTLKGSSEDGFDFLHLEWAPGLPEHAHEWERIKTWTGGSLASAYQQELHGSAKLLAHTGPMTVRLVFESNEACDSNPGDTEPSIAPENLPNPGLFDPSEIGPEDVDPGEPNPDDPPGRLPGYTGPTPNPSSGDPEGVVDPGETLDSVNCGETGMGWFIDSLQVVARRNFAALAPPSAPRITLDAAATGTVATNLISDMGKVLDFRIDEAAVTGGPFDSMAVLLMRSGSADQLTVPLQRGSGSVWSGLLAVDEPELIAGAWTAHYYGLGSDGAKVLAQRSLSVAAADQVAPAVSILPAAEAGQPIRLGPGSALQVVVQEPLLRRVTYSYPGLPAPLEMAFPFHLPEAALPEGPSQVTVVAVDRVGLTTTRTVSVDRDTIRPGVALEASSVVYAGVPFDLDVRIVERNAHTLTVDANGTVLTVDVPAAAVGEEASIRAQTLSITPPGTGDFTVTARVLDLIGNEAFAVQQFTAVKPVTDLTVSDVRLASDRNGVVREGQSLVAKVEQVGGVAPLPVTVVFEAAGRTASFNVTVPSTGPVEVTWNSTLRGGIHTVVARAIGPAIANETNPGNEEHSAQVEVFLGRITAGSDVYVIRADSRGLPAVALLSGSSKTFPLTVVDQAAGIAYQFTVAGNRTLTWDPLVPVSSVAAEEVAEDDKGAPFPGLVMVLLVLAMAAVTQRRRWP